MPLSLSFRRAELFRWLSQLWSGACCPGDISAGPDARTAWIFGSDIARMGHRPAHVVVTVPGKDGAPPVLLARLKCIGAYAGKQDSPPPVSQHALISSLQPVPADASAYLNPAHECMLLRSQPWLLQSAKRLGQVQVSSATVPAIARRPCLLPKLAFRG